MSLRLEIQLLRALVEVARAKSFTRAAAQLNLTQSAVSWQIKRLEDRIGRELLRRTPEGVVPTAAGRELLTRARRVLQAHDEAVEHFTRPNLNGRVRFGCAEDLIASHLGGLLERFRSLHPDVQLEIVVDLCPSLSQRVDSGDLDAAVVQFPEGSTTVGRVLWREQPMWVCGQGWVWGTGRSLPIVTFDHRSMYAEFVIEQLEASGLDWYPILECGSAAGVKAAVAAGVGVGILSSRQHGDQLGLVPESMGLPALPRCEFVLLSSNLEPTPPTAVLTELIVKELTDALAAAPEDEVTLS